MEQRQRSPKILKLSVLGIAVDIFRSSVNIQRSNPTHLERLRGRSHCIGTKTYSLSHILVRLIESFTGQSSLRPEDNFSLALFFVHDVYRDILIVF